MERFLHRRLLVLVVAAGFMLGVSAAADVVPKGSLYQPTFPFSGSTPLHTLRPDPDFLPFPPVSLLVVKLDLVPCGLVLLPCSWFLAEIARSIDVHPRPRPRPAMLQHFKSFFNNTNRYVYVFVFDVKVASRPSRVGWKPQEPFIDGVLLHLWFGGGVLHLRLHRPLQPPFVRPFRPETKRSCRLWFSAPSASSSASSSLTSSACRRVFTLLSSVRRVCVCVVGFVGFWPTSRGLDVICAA